MQGGKLSNNGCLRMFCTVVLYYTILYYNCTVLMQAVKLSNNGFLRPHNTEYCYTILYCTVLSYNRTVLYLYCCITVLICNRVHLTAAIELLTVATGQRHLKVTVLYYNCKVL